MDSTEDSTTDAESSCKRQKRDSGENLIETQTNTGMEENVEDLNTVSTSIISDDGNTNTEVESHSAVSPLNSLNVKTSSTGALDSDDFEDEDNAQDAQEVETDIAPESANAEPSASFNQRTIPRTRSYRRIHEMINEMSSDSNDSAPPVDSGEPSAAGGQELQNELRFSVDHMSSSSSPDSMPFHFSQASNSSTDSDSNDDDGTPISDAEDPVESKQVELLLSKILQKPKAQYNWNLYQALMNRENNLINRIGWRDCDPFSEGFAKNFYSSRHYVERMKRLFTLSRHSGCVNCLNFNRNGDLLCSGSDDLRIIIWDWANQKELHSIKSGHTLNIFQTKFIDSFGCLDIVSASRDGHVRRTVLPPSGGCAKPQRLYSHTNAVHKLAIVPHSRHEIMSAGEDAAVKHFDLRSSATATTLLRCTTPPDERVRLFSIHHHPYAPEFCISGSDDKLRVYDKRKCTEPVHEMTPKEIENKRVTQITCAVYNHSGSEILASYSDAGIYLFDSRNYKDGETLHSYEGLINSRTIKGVNFFGPHSEYVISGSDCGNIFFWDKNTEGIVNFMKGDHRGVVNCLEPHPWIPVLASSGLEHNVKIWAPTGVNFVAEESKLEETLLRNLKRNLTDPGDFDVNQFHHFIRQFLGPRQRNLHRSSDHDIDSSTSASSHLSRDRNTETPVSVRSGSSSVDDDDDADDEDGGARRRALIDCRTQ